MLKLLEEIEEEVALIEECLTDIIEQLILDSVKCHLERIVKEEMETEMLRCSEGKCKCIHEIDGLRKELIVCHSTINNTSLKLRQLLPPFCEESLDSDERVQFYTGLPNIKILKAVYDHVVETLTMEGNSKLSSFQQFMCTILKLRLNSPIQDLAFVSMFLQQLFPE